MRVVEFPAWDLRQLALLIDGRSGRLEAWGYYGELIQFSPVTLLLLGLHFKLQAQSVSSQGDVPLTLPVK